MKIFPVALFAVLSATAQVAPAAAQAYPIDCAILLCLAGGWPASAPCARARAEFIRRITPWPIEPPLQIWNCPMHTTWQPNLAPQWPIFETSYQYVRPAGDPHDADNLFPALQVTRKTTYPRVTRVQAGPVLAPPGQADIDISGHEFDFVRSIRVWHVRYSAWLTGSSKNCSVMSATDLGRYGIQGDFAWRRAALRNAPPWIQPTVSCQQPGTFRAVGVEWQDYLGRAGQELVIY